MKIITTKTNSKLTTIALTYQGGSALEIPNGFPLGTAHFLEHFMFKGTDKRNSFEISRQIGFYGGDQNAYTSHENVLYFMTVPTEHFEKALEVYHDMMTNPAFPEEELEKERQVILEEEAASKDSIHHIVANAASKEFYSNYERNEVLGTVDSINSISLDDLKRFYNMFYKKENMVISVSSSIAKDKLLNIIEGFFGKEDGVVTRPLKKQSSCVKKTKIVNIDRPELEQAHVSWNWQGFRKTNNKDSYVLTILSNILGGGMDSRLFFEVREKENLVYSIYSDADSGYSSGSFGVSFSTRPQNIDKAIALIKEELNKISEQNPSDEELQRAKNKIKTSLYQGWQSVEHLTLKKAESYLKYGKILNMTKTIEKINKVTQEEISLMAKRIFSGKNIMVIAKRNEI